EGPGALYGSVARGAPGDARGDLAAHSGAGLHDFRTAPRLRDRLSAVRAISGDRPRDRLGADVHGHDDAAAGDRVPALQADFLRAGGRLEPGGGLAGAEFRDDLRKFTKNFPSSRNDDGPLWLDSLC